MTAVLVSAKVSVFYSKFNQDFPQVFPTVLLGTNTNQTQKTQPKQRLDNLFITKQEQKARKKIKLGCLPTSAVV